jgi:hypothetical protein
MLKRFTVVVILVASLLLSTNCGRTPPTPERRIKTLLNHTWILGGYEIGIWYDGFTSDDVGDSLHFSLNVKKGAGVWDKILATVKGDTSVVFLRVDTLNPITQMNYWWVVDAKYDSIVFMVTSSDTSLPYDSSTVDVKVEKIYWE